MRTLLTIVCLLAMPSVVLSDEAPASQPQPLVELHGGDYAAATKGRDAADLARAAFEQKFKPGDRSQEAAAAAKPVADAYREVIRTWAWTEIEAYCRQRLAGLLMYQGRFDDAEAELKAAAERFRGTPLERDLAFDVGLFLLQARHDAEGAVPWFDRVAVPPATMNEGPIDPNHKHRQVYQQAQLQAVKSEIKLGRYAEAKRRIENLKLHYPDSLRYIDDSLASFLREFEVSADAFARAETRPATPPTE